MGRPLTVSIPHALGQAEALRRIRTGLDDAKARFSGQLSIQQEVWTDNRLDFRAGALGQSLAGTIVVEEAAVVLTVELPWVLAVLAEKAKALVSRQGTLMLEKR